jgi:hypothetical protein
MAHGATDARTGSGAGQIWTRIEAGQPFECYLHPENAEMVMRMATATGATFTAEPAGEHWLWLTMTPKETSR